MYKNIKICTLKILLCGQCMVNHLYIDFYVCYVLRMSMFFLLILTWMISLPPDSIISASSSHDQRVLIVNNIGISSVQCCAYGKCYCSNLSLALEHIQSNTEIRIMSDISLHGVPQFECTNDAKVTIIGYNNPVVKCSHQGGLVGRNFGHIVIHAVTWDGCDQGIEIDGFVNVHIIQCDFLHILSPNSALTLRGHGSVCINNSVFNNIANRGVYLSVDSDDISAVPSITVYNSTLNNATFTIIINDIKKINTNTENFSNEHGVFIFWLHELHFNFTIIDCFNNLCGPAQVYICCDSCDERYEYIVDSFHNNVTMISNDTVVSCPISEGDAIKLVATVNDINANGISVSTKIDIIISPTELAQNCDDIAHVWVQNASNGTLQCLPLSCNLSSFESLNWLPVGMDCCGSKDYRLIPITPGYWYCNGFRNYTDLCPQGHCNSDFDLYNRIESANATDASYPTSDDQCIANWTGLACGECAGDNFIRHDSTSCISSDKCFLNSQGLQLALFFFISLLYWIMVISLIFVLLHFKFDITVGYAYGLLFYYSVLEQTVNASYVGTQNNLNEPHIMMSLTILSTIGNMKPPLQPLKLCFSEFMMIDHTFLTYFHPVIVTCLIFVIFISARNSVTVARTIGRYVNSKSICILLILSYSSVSYTSLQLFRPLAIMYDRYSISWYKKEWHSYLSPTEKYFHSRHMIYCIIAILCEVVIVFGVPFVLLMQPYLTRYFNINFTSIKPVIDQLKGCYKEEYRWFAAYYLICRQVIYAVDIGTDFSSSIKYPVMLTIYILIMMVHVWLQPYKQRKLNTLDSSILMTLIFVFIGEHTSYGSTFALWILPLVLFINCIGFSSRWKYLLMPISCLGMIALSLYVVPILLPIDWSYSYDELDFTFYGINLVIGTISFIILLAYLICVSKFLYVIVIKRHQRPEYRPINLENADDTNEDSDTNDVI